MHEKCKCIDAVAQIRGNQTAPNLRGTAVFHQKPRGVLAEIQVEGLPRDNAFFALHIHEGNSCRGEDFADTGLHYNPDGAAHPYHAGDLPPLLSCDGNAYMTVFTNRFSVREILGKTLVIHSHPDDFHTQPAGNAGEKIACGVIKK